MLIKRRTSHHPTEQDVTPETVYQDRRRILKGLGLGVGAATLAFPVKASLLDLFAPDKPAPWPHQTPRHPCRDPARGIDPHPGGEGHHPQQFLRAGDRQGGSGPQRPLPQARALDPEGGRGGGQTLHPGCVGSHQQEHAGGAHLSAALRGGLVHGVALERHCAGGSDPPCRAHQSRQVRGLRDPL